MVARAFHGEGHEVIVLSRSSRSTPWQTVEWDGVHAGPWLNSLDGADVLLNLHDPTGRWPWLSWAAWLEANGIEDFSPGSTLTLDQYDQVINAALHGQGVAIGRMTLVDQYVRRKQLVALFGPSQRVARAFHAIYARNAQARPEVRQFVEWLKGEISRGG